MVQNIWWLSKSHLRKLINCVQLCLLNSLKSLTLTSLAWMLFEDPLVISIIYWLLLLISNIHIKTNFMILSSNMKFNQKIDHKTKSHQNHWCHWNTFLFGITGNHQVYPPLSLTSSYFTRNAKIFPVNFRRTSHSMGLSPLLIVPKTCRQGG